MKSVRIVQLYFDKSVPIDDDEFVVDVKFVFDKERTTKGEMYAVVVKGDRKQRN